MREHSRFKPVYTFSLLVSVAALSACASSGTDTAKPVTTATPKSTVASTIDGALEQAIVDAESRGNKQESLSILDQIYKRNAGDAMVASRYARALREDEQLKRARQVLAPHIGGKNPHPEALTEMAMVNLGLGQYPDAEISAQQAIDIDPAQAGRAYLALGTAQDAQGNHKAAEESFRKGLNIWKGDPAPILNNLALNLAAQGNIDEALAVLERARKLSPGRMEIERNYRIISTLNEGGSAKKPAAIEPAAAPTPPKKPAKN